MTNSVSLLCVRQVINLSKSPAFKWLSSVLTSHHSLPNRQGSKHICTLHTKTTLLAAVLHFKIDYVNKKGDESQLRRTRQMTAPQQRSQSLEVLSQTEL